MGKGKKRYAAGRCGRCASSPEGQIISHVSEDYEHLSGLGFTLQGDHVIISRYVRIVGDGARAAARLCMMEPALRMLLKAM